MWWKEVCVILYKDNKSDMYWKAPLTLLTSWGKQILWFSLACKMFQAIFMIYWFEKCLVQGRGFSKSLCGGVTQGGVLAVYMMKGSNGASYCEPKKIHEPEILHPKKYLTSKFSTPKSTRPSTSILIYSIKQTLRPKKIHNRSLDPKKYWGCKFSTQKNTSDLPVMYTASTPPGGCEPCLTQICDFSNTVSDLTENLIPYSGGDRPWEVGCLKKRAIPQLVSAPFQTRPDILPGLTFYQTRLNLIAVLKRY